VERLKLLCVVGARPNFMKVAPVMAAAGRWNRQPDHSVYFEPVLVHTGQHYDVLLSRIFFQQLGLPEPDEHLGVGSGSHALQTARLLEALEPVVCRHRPDAVLVPGDVNSTCAAALVAAKLNVPVVHLEAGLRSGDRSMPEEINRIVADHVADLLLTSCPDGDDNLLREGVERERIVDIGNTMIDSLSRLRPQAEATLPSTRARLGLGDGPLVLVTLHRPSNVDEPGRLAQLLEMLADISLRTPVVFPVHLRTRARIAELGAGAAPGRPRLHLIEPLGYLEFLGLMTQASAVVTDSGGVQEETTFLGVPCVTVRTTTERPVTVTLGTNRLVDPGDMSAILGAVEDALAVGPAVPTPAVPLWDGHAGERAIEALALWAGHRP
jgi:UDP-N-acetylglucosamine 2-epimerase (non-hydrolysing)